MRSYSGQTKLPARHYCPDRTACGAGTRGPCRKCQPEKLQALAEGNAQHWTPAERELQAARLKAQHRTAEFVAAVLPARRSNVAKINARRKA